MQWQNRHETAWVLHLWAHGHPSDSYFWGTQHHKTGRVGYGPHLDWDHEWDHIQGEWADWLEKRGYTTD